MTKIFENHLLQRGYYFYPGSAHNFVRDKAALNKQFRSKDQQDSVLGIGCGSVSQLEINNGILYYRLTQDYSLYQKLLDRNIIPVAGVFLEKKEKMLTYIFKNLYYQKQINKTAFLKKFKEKLDVIFASEIRALADDKILKNSKEAVEICCKKDNEYIFFKLLFQFISEELMKKALIILVENE